ncbi:MAG: competence protein ComEC family protein [Bacteroidales bacterium]|nr:competence protein ComEC family protein [Bacteroidales bacterium]
MIYHYFSDKPFVKLLIPFVIGIFIFRIFPVPFHIHWAILCILLFCALLLTHVLYKKYSRFIEWLWGIILSLFFVVYGFTLSSINYAAYKEKKYTKENATIIGVVAKQPEIKEKFVKAIINIDAIKIKNQWEKTDGNSLVYLEKDSRSMLLQAGDEILFNAKLNIPENFGNPNEFDYKNYLLYHLINTTGKIKAKDWLVINKSKQLSVLIFAEKCRNYFLGLLRKMNLSDDVFAITSAIVLGYKNDIDAEIQQAYASAGATHILAVSGLHVGVVYLVISFMLSFLKRNKYLFWIHLIVVLLFLWFYALVTGLSPSVLRATTMFSFVAIARSIKRKTNIYNTISASALFLLMFNPFQLFEIGFQLSYMAVLGIVYFQPKFKNLLYVKNKMLDNVWSLICVTLAAQLVTTPLSLYYFHQFPVYFLLSGIVLVPLVSLVIYNALLLFTFSWLPIVAQYIAFPLQELVTFMNDFTIFIEQLPYSVIQPIFMSFLLLILSYAFILSLSYFFTSKKIIWLQLSLIILFISSLSLIFREFSIHNQQKVIVYNIPGISTLNLIDGKDNIIFIDSVFKEKVVKSAKSNWVQLGLEKEKTLTFNHLSTQYLFTNFLTLDNSKVWYYRDVIVFNNFRILLLKDKTWFKTNEKLNKKINVDVIIVQNKAKVNFRELLRHVDANVIVFDSSCSSNKINLWLSQLTNFRGTVHVVAKQKAWLYDIKKAASL